MCIVINRHDYDAIPDIGSHVSFKDKLYEVRGIESFVKLLHPPIPGDNVGLLVKEISDVTS